jgi:hypothetical protein
VTSMGMLITALALAASLVQPQAASPDRRLAAPDGAPQTLYASPSGTIQAFAQDGPLLAWFSPSAKACNAIWVLSLDNGGRVHLPDETSAARNVTCRWDVAPPVYLALAGPDVLWTLRQRQSTLPYDYVLGAGLQDPRERRFQEIAHAKQGAGLWLGGIAGDTVGTGVQAVSTLVYGIAAVQYVDEIDCLSGGSCLMKLAGGGVYRVVGRKPPTLIPNTSAAVAVSVSGSTLAYVPAADTSDQGRPVAAADLPIEIVDVDTGASIAHISPEGKPLAIALAPHVLVSLERATDGLKLAWYSATTGDGIGSVAVPAGTVPVLSANDQIAVFRIGRFLHVLTFATAHSRTVVQTAGLPIGVSLEGSRLAWAENVRGRGRIRALYLTGSD